MQFKEKGMKELNSATKTLKEKLDNKLLKQFELLKGSVSAYNE